jgi:hypothetical protein
MTAHQRVAHRKRGVGLPALLIRALKVGCLRPRVGHELFLPGLHDARAGRGRDARDRIGIQFVEPRRARHRLRLSVARRRDGARQPGDAQQFLFDRRCGGRIARRRRVSQVAQDAFEGTVIAWQPAGGA